MTWNISSTSTRIRVAVIFAIGTTAFASQVLAQDATIEDSTWARMDGRTLDTLPPVFLIRPTHFASAGRGGSSGIARSGNKVLGRNISFDALMSLAHDVDVIRVVSPPDKPAGGFDLLMTTPDASKEKLQEEIARRFGYVGRTESRPTDVLLLQLKQTGAPGLQTSQPDPPSQPRRRGTVSSTSTAGMAGPGVRTRTIAVRNQPVAVFLKNIQGFFDRPLVDHTGLTGNFDFTVDVALATNGSERDALLQAMPTQLGMELVSTREPLELLLVQKPK